MKNLLITGGSGFIGSHLCLILLKNNYSLYVLDSFVNSSSKALNSVLNIYKNIFKDSDPKLTIYQGDLRDKHFLEKLWNSDNPPWKCW